MKSQQEQDSQDETILISFSIQPHKSLKPKYEGNRFNYLNYENNRVLFTGKGINSYILESFKGKNQGLVTLN